MKKLFVSAWVLLTAAVLGAALAGFFSQTALIVFSLVGLTLIYVFALGSIIAQTREIRPGQIKGNNKYDYSRQVKL